MLQLGFAAFRALPNLAQLAIVAALVASLYGGYRTWKNQIYTNGYNAGYSQAIADVDTANQEGISEADKQDAKRRTCIARGGTWDISVGVCR